MISGLFSNIHWIAVVLMTIFSFVLGALWHQPFLFGKPWKKANYPGEEPVKVNAPLVFGGTALMHFIALAGLSAVVSGMGAGLGLTMGLLVALIWVFPALSGTYLFANRSIKLLCIDAGMYVILFAFSGLVFGMWR